MGNTSHLWQVVLFFLPVFQPLLASGVVFLLSSSTQLENLQDQTKFLQPGVEQVWNTEHSSCSYERRQVECAVAAEQKQGSTLDFILLCTTDQMQIYNNKRIH